MELTIFDGRILKGQITRFSNGYERIVKYIDRLNRKYNKIAYKKLNDMARNAVDEFYDGFTPGRYRRTHSLRRAYKVYTTDTAWEVLVGPEFMTGEHRASSDIIYYNSLIVGVHGGAWRGNTDGIDDYYWRKPHPDYTEWWESPAPRGPENIEQKILDQAEEIISDLESEMQEDFDTYASNIINDLMAGLKPYM